MLRWVTSLDIEFEGKACESIGDAGSRVVSWVREQWGDGYYAVLRGVVAVFRGAVWNEGKSQEENQAVHLGLSSSLIVI